MDWLDALMECTSITVIRTDTPLVQIEALGVAGWAYQGVAGICIGVELKLDSENLQWLRSITLFLAASEHLCDDGIGMVDGKWILWHRYEPNSNVEALEAVLAAQLALAHQFAGLSARHGTSNVLEIGRTI